MSTPRRKALITGAGRNIGREIALRLAQAGCDVAIGVRDNAARGETVAEAARGLGVEAIVSVGDLGSRDGVAQVAQRVLKSFGHIDIPVNVASARPFKAFLEMGFEDWQTVMDVSVTGVFRLTQACLPGMVAPLGTHRQCHGDEFHPRLSRSRSDRRHLSPNWL